MRKLALLTTVCVLAVLTWAEPAMAQGVGARCKSNTAICIGDKNNDVYVGGNLYANSPDGGSVIFAAGNGTSSVGKFAKVDAGVLNVEGAARIAGSANVVVNLNAGSVDAGTLFVRGNEQHAGTIQGTLTADLVDAGNVNIQGTLGLNQALHCGAAVACGTCNLASASPSTCTATVTAGSTCLCYPVGTTAAIAAGGCAGNVSSTTATFTGPNTVTTTIFYQCYK